MTDQLCKAEDIAVDASITGSVYEYTDSDGQVKFAPSFTGKEPYDLTLYCHACGYEENYSGSFDDAVKRHIAPKLVA